MDRSMNARAETRSQTSEESRGRKQPTYLKVTNCSTTSFSGVDSSVTPKRKLSVFCRSFDVITRIDQEKEQEKVVEFRRTSSSPSVRTTDPHKTGFVDNCRTLIETGQFFSSQNRPDKISRESSEEQAAKAATLSPATLKLPEVLEDRIVDNYATITESSIGKHYKLNKNGKHRVKEAASENMAIDSRRQDDSSLSMNAISKSSRAKKIENVETGRSVDFRSGNSTPSLSIDSRATVCTDLAKIKDSEHPRAFVNASSAGRLGKYTPVDAEMSSYEDSSIGSDSEDDSIGKRAREDAKKMNEMRPNSNGPLVQSSVAFSAGELVGDADSSDGCKLITETAELPKVCTELEKRQGFFAARRSLSEGDHGRYQRVKRYRSRSTKRENFFEEQEREREHCSAFPSLSDTRLKTIGLAIMNDIDSLYRENIPESELERKYVGLSIGLSTDRITLQRRMALSKRHRDQAERNFQNEVQRMQEDIQDLCPLCTDQESIDKVTKVRNRLDMIERSVRAIAGTAETLGAVCQEFRISKAIYIGDKYLQLLRTRCENLAAEIAETKQILWKNNIVIEETSSEIGDDLSKLRYRNGLPGNNRTMVARRRASIATISRPLNSQEVVKEAPRCCSQRNSVSGRITLRRPSLSSEMQSNTNSVLELRDIFEHTESRRNSVEENNNLLRIHEGNTIDATTCDTVNKSQSKERLITKQNSFILESKVSKVVEKQLKSCIRTAEPLRLTRNIETWRPAMWYTLAFFLGYFTKQITSTLDSCDLPP